MKLDDVNQLFEPGYMTMETGVTRLSNNDMYVAVLTRPVYGRVHAEAVVTASIEDYTGRYGAASFR